MSGTRESSRLRFLITPRWLGWHVFIVLSVLVMLWLGDWQLHRALSGNSLSWAYTFEWPLFSIFAVVFWVKTIRDEVHPPVPAEPGDDAVMLPGGISVPSPEAPRTAAGGEAPADAHEELAAYNAAYLAHLTKEVKGHGRWHGLR